MVRRILTLVFFAGLGLALGGGMAVAEDLEDFLERAAEADFAGSQIVVSIWDGQTETIVIEIEQAGSRLMVGSAERFVEPKDRPAPRPSKTRMASSVAASAGACLR